MKNTFQVTVELDGMAMVALAVYKETLINTGCSEDAAEDCESNLLRYAIEQLAGEGVEAAMEALAAMEAA